MNEALSALVAKKEKYLSLREEISNFDYGIEKRVEAYRESIMKEAEEDKTRKLEKVDVYLELLDELISETQEKLEKQSNDEEQTAEELKEEGE